MLKPLQSVQKPADPTEAGRATPKLDRQVLEPQKHAELAAATGDQKRIAVGKINPIVPGGAGLASVIGLDERTRIVTTELSPYALICALEISSPWGNFVGTGWFVGPRTLITAGHCVLHRSQMGGWATSIRIWPGADGDERPHPAIEAKRFSTTSAWDEGEDPDHDVGAIHLDADALPVGMTPFRVGVLRDDELLSHSINVSGYPGDKGGFEQWWARNRIRAVRPLRIFYEVDTMGGQSGAPAFVVERAGTTPLVVGIHAYGVGGTPSDLPMEVNSAPRITPAVLDLIRGWVDQDSPGFSILT